MPIFATETSVMSTDLQYGAFGICLILLGLVFWLIRRVCESNDRVIDQHKTSAEVIERNTQAIRAVGDMAKSALDVSIEAKEKLLERPCIARQLQQNLTWPGMVPNPNNNQPRQQ